MENNRDVLNAYNKAYYRIAQLCEAIQYGKEFQRDPYFACQRKLNWGDVGSMQYAVEVLENLDRFLNGGDEE